MANASEMASEPTVVLDTNILLDTHGLVQGFRAVNGQPPEDGLHPAPPAAAHDTDASSPSHRLLPRP